ISGFDPQVLEDHWPGAVAGSTLVKSIMDYRIIQRNCADVIWSMGLAANTLKNKPWKNTHMATDVEAFKYKLDETWRRVLKLWVHLGADDEFIFELYAKKCQVNKFRQDTNY
ncbi:hypothetical protein LCGC14_1827470, partial [marine sediment metagenome]